MAKKRTFDISSVTKKVKVQTFIIILKWDRHK
jgi:hypothetical protein